MLRFVVRRLLWAIPTLFIVTFLVYCAIRLGTDPVAAYKRSNTRASAKKIAQYIETNGLDPNYLKGYFRWAGKFLFGDWPRSIKGSREVWPNLKRALANSAVLGGLASTVGISLGLLVGIFAALRPGSKRDIAVTTSSFIGLSIPPYVTAIIAQLLFAVTLPRWFGLDNPILPTSGLYPAGHHGFDLVLRLKYMALPITIVAIQVIAAYSRYMRASLLEVVNADFLRTARAKGISERQVLVRHTLRNALIPIVTLIALEAGAILGGLIITEFAFEYPGAGRYFLKALGDGDFPLIMPWMVIVTLSVIMFNLLADLSYAWLDPRIRLD
jgi:peptide/nickel transport system permease protein